MKFLSHVLFGILLLQAFTAFAQDHYLFAPGTRIYDLPGDHFLTYRIANNKVYLEDRDASGLAIWSDSLSNAAHPLAFQLERFAETGKYRVFIQDSVVTWHSTFSADAHQFGPFRSDTLSTWYRRTACPQTDTSLYVFSGDYAGVGVLDHAVWTITESGTTTLLSVMLQSAPVTEFRFLPHQGGILELYNNYGWMHSRQFDADLQQTSPVYSDSTTAGYGFPELIYSRVKNEDSIFVFFYNYDLFAVPERQAWMMAWLTPEMDTLSVYENSFNPNVYPNYPIGFDDVVLTDDYIYVYAYKYYGSGVPSPRQLVVFDYAFDTVCTFLTDELWQAELLLLNEEAYIIWDDNPAGVELFRVEPCGVTGLNAEEAPAVRVYPNPSNGMVTIDFEPGTVETVGVYDLNGKTLRIDPVKEPAKATIDLTGFEGGIYILRLAGENGMRTVRIVLENR